MKTITPGHKYELGVYCILNIITGRAYVGSTGVGFSKRLLSHLWGLGNRRHCNHKLQADFDTFGLDAFSFEVLEVCESAEKMLVREKFWIAALGAFTHGYNIRKDPTANRTGAKLSDESKALMSRLKTGKKLRPEHVEKVRLARIGFKFSEESKRRMSEKAKGRPTWSKGKRFSTIHRSNISKSRLGKYPRKIKCSNGVVYDGVTVAAANLGINRRAIGAIISGRRASVRGLVFSEQIN